MMSQTSRDFSGLPMSTGLEELFSEDESKWETLFHSWQELDDKKKS